MEACNGHDILGYLRFYIFSNGNRNSKEKLMMALGVTSLAVIALFVMALLEIRKQQREKQKSHENDRG